jgi:hypothetical protein
MGGRVPCPPMVVTVYEVDLRLGVGGCKVRW